MNKKMKIHELWKYLGLQDNETLIIRLTDTEGKQSYEIVTLGPAGLNLKNIPVISDFEVFYPFRLIQQMDAEGQYVIPSVDQIERDKISDY